VLIAAAATVVSILNLCQFEMLFPVRTFFLKGSRAIAHFDPTSRPVGAKPRVLHVAQVFSFGNRALAEGFILDGLEQFLFPTLLQPCADQISHSLILRARGHLW